MKLKKMFKEDCINGKLSRFEKNEYIMINDYMEDISDLFSYLEAICQNQSLFYNHRRNHFKDFTFSVNSVSRKVYIFSIFLEGIYADKSGLSIKVKDIVEASINNKVVSEEKYLELERQYNNTVGRHSESIVTKLRKIIQLKDQVKQLQLENEKLKQSIQEPKYTILLFKAKANGSKNVEDIHYEKFCDLLNYLYDRYIKDNDLDKNSCKIEKFYDLREKIFKKELIIAMYVSYTNSNSFCNYFMDAINGASFNISNGKYDEFIEKYDYWYSCMLNNTGDVIVGVVTERDIDRNTLLS